MNLRELHNYLNSEDAEMAEKEVMVLDNEGNIYKINDFCWDEDNGTFFVQAEFTESEE